MTRYTIMGVVVAILYASSLLSVLPNLAEEPKDPNAYVMLAQVIFLLGFLTLIMTEINSFITNQASEEKWKRKYNALVKRVEDLEQKK